MYSFRMSFLPCIRTSERWCPLRAALIGGLFALCSLTMEACRTGDAQRRDLPAPERLEGGRASSPSRRASDERPHPWEEERRPFEADRMSIDAARVRRKAEQAPKADKSRKTRRQEPTPAARPDGGGAGR